MDDLCSEDGQSIYDNKIVVYSVTVAKISFFCDTTFYLNKLNHIRYAMHGHPNCFWNVGCQIVSVLTFLTGVSAKLKREHVKRYAVALSVWGASRSRLCPGPLVHLIRPWACTVTLSNNKVFTRWICEDKWHHHLDAQINIQNMILPRVKQFSLFFCVLWRGPTDFLHRPVC